MTITTEEAEEEEIRTSIQTPEVQAAIEMIEAQKIQMAIRDKSAGEMRVEQVGENLGVGKDKNWFMKIWDKIRGV